MNKISIASLALLVVVGSIFITAAVGNWAQQIGWTPEDTSFTVNKPLTVDLGIIPLPYT